MQSLGVSDPNCRCGTYLGTATCGQLSTRLFTGATRDENWRDIALVSWGWGREWVPREINEGKVEELEFGESVPRTGSSVVRSLTNALNSGPLSRHILGCFETGEVICQLNVFRKGNSDVTSSAIFDTAHVYSSVTFEDIEPSQNYYRTPPSYVRTHATACCLNPGTLSMRHYRDGHHLAECPRIFSTTTTICGNHIFQLRNSGNTMTPGCELHVSSLLNPSYRYELFKYLHIGFNETMLAYSNICDDPTDDSALNFITLIDIFRLSDKRLLGTYQSRSTVRGLQMSRFNLFLCVADDSAEYGMTTAIEVLNFSAHLLYTIQITPTQCTDPDWMIFWDREVLIFDYNTSAITVLDPIEGTSQKIESSPRSRRWNTENPQKECIITMVEYPADTAGRRTGARGKTKCLRRWLTKNVG
ncbi:hypothetical protein HDV00_010805 [Rhizophlyctis rosea]|nr:hypothetical protein HDV00_010805 [Rhizophlyctis rosea]